MSASDARLIIFLLAAILAVLLLGREAVLSSTQTIFWAGLVGLVGWIAWLLIKSIFVETPKELLSELRDLRRARKPWIAEAILIVGLPFGLVWIAGLVAEKYFGFTALKSYTDLAGLIWFVFCPIFLAGMLIRWVRSPFSRPGSSVGVADLKRNLMMEDMLGFALEDLDKDRTRIQVRHTESGTTFTFPIDANGRPSGKYFVGAGLSPELRSGAPIDIDDAETCDDLAGKARDAATVLLGIAR